MTLGTPPAEATAEPRTVRELQAEILETERQMDALDLLRHQAGDGEALAALKADWAALERRWGRLIDERLNAEDDHRAGQGLQGSRQASRATTSEALLQLARVLESRARARELYLRWQAARRTSARLMRDARLNELLQRISDPRVFDVLTAVGRTVDVETLRQAAQQVADFGAALAVLDAHTDRLAIEPAAGPTDATTGDEGGKP